MKKITFKNGQAPYLSDITVNQMQNNIEEAINHTYSSDEKEIGTWINGKKLYSKTIQMQGPNVATDGTFVNASSSVSDLNAEFIAVKEAYAIHSNSNIYSIPYTTNSNYEVKAFYDSSLHSIVIASNAKGFSNCTCIVQIIYTKAGD